MCLCFIECKARQIHHVPASAFAIFGSMRQQQQKSFPVVWQTAKNKQNYQPAELKDYSHSRADLIRMDSRDNKAVKADCEREEDCADNEITTPLPIYFSMLQHPLRNGAGWAAAAPFLLLMNVSQ
jgi:hypothetical protein